MLPNTNVGSFYVRLHHLHEGIPQSPGQRHHLQVTLTLLFLYTTHATNQQILQTFLQSSFQNLTTASTLVQATIASWPDYCNSLHPFSLLLCFHSFQSGFQEDARGNNLKFRSYYVHLLLKRLWGLPSQSSWSRAKANGILPQLSPSPLQAIPHMAHTSPAYLKSSSVLPSWGCALFLLSGLLSQLLYASPSTFISILLKATLSQWSSLRTCRTYYRVTRVYSLTW